MKARKLIEGATYGPETLKVIGKAFDDAWSEISGHFENNGLQSHSARLKLAHALLAVARDDSRDSDELKNGALQIMAMNYRDQSDPSRPVGWQPAVVTNSANMHAHTKELARNSSQCRINV